MKIISEANQAILSILTSMLRASENSRLIKYCVQTYVDDGILLYNLLTKELLLVNEDEYATLLDNKYLKEHWFVIPEDVNEKEYAELVRWILSNRKRVSKEITSYTIFTTTDCNARCFYCYELGCSRISMSLETARKVVQYIKSNCGGHKVKITWFGGEPLYNIEAIDAICEGLHKEGVEFVSSMISNGYLFDKETVRKGISHWYLKKVQISLDGTETTYNRVKAYIYPDTNPYERVLQNIAILLNASITVTIRLNMDLYNAGELLELVDDLEKRFGSSKHLRIYAHHLFQNDKLMTAMHTKEAWKLREEAMRCLNMKIAESGFSIKFGVEKEAKINYCMADTGNAVTILPTGNIGLCEHFSENEFIGHIDQDGFDNEVIASWREKASEGPECADCFYYPSCIKLKKCPNTGLCFEQTRNDYLHTVKQAMLYEYHNSK